LKGTARDWSMAIENTEKKKGRKKRRKRKEMMKS